MMIIASGKILQPRLWGYADEAKDAAERGVIAAGEHRYPDEAGDYLGHGIRQKDHRVDEAPEAERTAEEDGGDEAEDKLADHRRAEDEPKGYDQRIPETVVIEEAHIVAHADEARVAGRRSD